MNFEHERHTYETQLGTIIKTITISQLKLLCDVGEQFNKLIESPLATQTEGSAKKGLLGELNFEHIIQESEYNIENMSKRGKRGDFILTDDTDPTRVLVEIKNYSRAVPTDEITKFYRDLRANSTMDAGIIISYNTRFTGRPKKSVSEEYFMNGIKKIPVLFIVNSNSSFILQNIDMLFTSVRLKNRSDLIREDIISSGLRSLKDHSCSLSQIRNTSGELLGDVSKHVQSINSYSLELEHSLSSTITDICRHLEITDIVAHNDAVIAYKYMVNNYKISASASKLLQLLTDQIHEKVCCDLPESKTSDDIFMFNKNSVVISMPNQETKTIFFRTRIELFIPMTLIEFSTYILRIKCIDKVKYNKGLFMEITDLTYEYVRELVINGV